MTVLSLICLLCRRKLPIHYMFFITCVQILSINLLIVQQNLKFAIL
jgi:hypothetical protein